MIICASFAAINQLVLAVGGSIAFLGILGEIGWHLDDYSRNPLSSFLEGEAEGN